MLHLGGKKFLQEEGGGTVRKEVKSQSNRHEDCASSAAVYVALIGMHAATISTGLSTGH